MLRSMLQSRLPTLFSKVHAAKGHPGQQSVLAEALQYGVSSTNRLDSSYVVQVLCKFTSVAAPAC
jgi:hypothetical protein